MTNRKNHHNITPDNKKKMIVVAISIFLLFSLLIIQFFKLQIIDGDIWSEKAQNLHEIVVTEPFQRGTFYSNTSIKKGHPETSQPFVIDVPKFHLYIDPVAIPENHRKDIAEKLFSLVSLPSSQWDEFFRQFTIKSRSRKLTMWIGKDTKENILSWWSPLARKNKIARNAIFFINDYQRSYPFGKLLGQVLHTIRSTKEETTKQALPTGGLEHYFNSQLKGSLGKRTIIRSLRHPIEKSTTIVPPENGADIYLTINHYLQAITEEELAKGVKRAQAAGGWAVLMEPNTGEIWALAQYPFFNPSNYSEYFNDTELINYTYVKSAVDAYEPGSVMKPVTIATALLANKALQSMGKKELFSPDEKIATSSGHFPGRSRPIRDTHLHHFLNMNLAMQKSSNIYMGKLAQRIVDTLGNDWYRSILKDTFALGQETGIELPSESSGLIPRPGKKHPNGTLEWSLSTPYSLAMGYNMQVNSLQLARIYSIFANGGFLVKPTLVRKIVKTSNNGKEEIILNNTTPERRQSFPRVLDADIVEKVVTAMKYVTKPGGTAKRADISGYTEAGKSNTSEKIVNGVYSKEKYIAGFAGFAPADKPRFVLIVTIDEPAHIYIPGLGKNWHGGHSAAPVFQQIARNTLEYLGVSPDDPHGYPTGDPRHDSQKADWVMETKDLQKIYEKWNEQPHITGKSR